MVENGKEISIEGSMTDRSIICCICGLDILAKERMNREHEPPLSRGGKQADWKWAHYICNEIKSDMTMDEFNLVAQERYFKALKWHIKSRDKQTIHRILRQR